MDVRRFRALVRTIDAGEVWQGAAASLGIQTFGVAPLALLEWRVDEDLYELSCREQPPRGLPLCSKRRDERGKDNEPGIHHEAGDLGGAPDVLGAVGVGEAEITIESMSKIVAVQEIRVMAGCVEALLEAVGDRRFS